jgi:hypothetical protein
LDYTNVDAMKEANNGSQLTNQTRYCKSWIFAENETQTLITEVSLKCITGLETFVCMCVWVHNIISLMVGPKKEDFLPKINILKENHCIL